MNKALEYLLSFVKEKEPERSCPVPWPVELTPIQEKKQEPLYSIPQIEDVHIEGKLRGKYKTKLGKARGLVVHFTAGRFDRGRESAINSLSDLCSRNLGCLFMDIDGKIYKARNQNLDDVMYHAGESKWQGVSGISNYCFGMEICNAGKLNERGAAWYGQEIPIEKRRTVFKRDNMQRGTYHAFTPDQEKSLINFCLWQLHTNPEFRLDWIVGHDEICVPAGRKNDPGGALSMSMPEFRAHLLELIQVHRAQSR